jgi:pectin methylesterase-like acyl-CoA thioesterase
VQKGIEAAAEGDTVVVAQGTYVETLRLKGRDLVLRSADPLDAQVITNTVVDANWATAVVTFAGTETERCVLEGFTLLRGAARQPGDLAGGICGGNETSRTHATVRHNRIIENGEVGIAYCNGLIEDNTIAQNRSWNRAGGLTGCDGVIRNNRIVGNGTFAEGAAGGLSHCHGVIENNIISGNSSSAEQQGGGGLAFCTATIRGNTITGNSGNPRGGGGMDHCTGLIEHNVITRNTTMGGGALAHCDGVIAFNRISENGGSGIYQCPAVVQNNLIVSNASHGVSGCDGVIQNNTIHGNAGYGLYDCHGPISSCIVWGNLDNAPVQLVESSVPAFSCIQHWPGGGQDNFGFAPHFVDAAAGDFHLLSWSPCVDAGNPASDYSDEPQPNGQRIDLGAFGNTAEATPRSGDNDTDGLPDDWEQQWFGSLDKGAADDPDADGVVNLIEYRYGWDPVNAAETRVRNRTQSRGYETIQAALREAADGDEIVVEPGRYRENVEFAGKNVVLRGTAPADPQVIWLTVIEGYPSGPVVRFAGTEDGTCVLAGFTVRHGDDVNCSQVAGGICGGTPELHTEATIRNNVITGNKAEMGAAVTYCDGLIWNNTITNNQAWAGGGLAFCDGLIRDNTIAQNRATYGGGLYNCVGMIDGNVVAENLGHGGGGGLLGCDGLIQDNTIRGNWTEQDESGGGGLKSCHALIRNNRIVGNHSRCDGGGGLSWCDGTIENNLITANSTDGMGGGLYSCRGLIQNNTIADNSSRWSCGGMAYCTGEIRNCIVWGNVPAYTPQLSDCSPPTYSCIERWTGGGLGNLAVDPHFVDRAAGNYHLLNWSPCIDAGDPASDYSGEPSPDGGRVDLGAYGNTAEATSASGDGDGDGLPDSWEQHWFGNLAESGNSDPDGDRIVNATEFRYAWDPTVSSVTRVQNLSQNRWYQTIQAALVEAADGDEIVVHPAVYRENILVGGRNVVLRGADPTRTATVTETVIDGQQAGPVITFTGTETAACTLAGLTLRNGVGGIVGSGTRATLQFNRVTQNSGPGLTGCAGPIRNNTIWANSAGYGGGLLECAGAIENCTVFGNVASWGGGLHECHGAIRNCIIWGNSAERDPQVFHSSMPSYSCIQEWYGGGEGNVARNSLFVAPEQGDFHLASWSPCIDAGDPTSDFSREPAPNGERVNLGAYGNTPEATSRSADVDADGLPDDWERRWFGDLRFDAGADPDGDGILNALEYRYDWSPTTASETLVRNVSQGITYASVQAALGEATSDDQIVVHPGIYRENLRFPVRNIVLTSTYATNPGAIFRTILDGGGRGPVVTFAGNEDSSCIFSGFTIQNGQGDEAGGIYGQGTGATMSSLVVRSNTAVLWGGGLSGCNGRIHNTLITGNSAREGSALFRCDGEIRNCTIAGNSAEWFGPVYQCHATIRNSIIWNNPTREGGDSIWPAVPTYSCIEGWTDGGTGNLAQDPQFVNAAGSDYRLRSSSPCLDAGDNTVLNLPATDLAGGHRLIYGGRRFTIDMGAFEHCIHACALEPAAGGVTLTWSSLSGRGYSILWSQDLHNWLPAVQVPSAGNTTTSWMDDGSQTGGSPPQSPHRFYRIQELP